MKDIINTLIIPTAGLIIMGILAGTYPLRRKNQLKKWGKLLYEVNCRTNKLFVIILALAPIIVFLLYFRDLGTMQNLILTLTGVLAIELVLRDMLLRKRCGVYENALVADGRILPKDEIYRLPTLEYENTEDYKSEKEKDEFAADAAETAAKVIQIVTKTRGTLYIGFESAEERNNTVEIIRKWTNQ